MNYKAYRNLHISPRPTQEENKSLQLTNDGIYLAEHYHWSIFAKKVRTTL